VLRTWMNTNRTSSATSRVDLQTGLALRSPCHSTPSAMAPTCASHPKPPRSNTSSMANPSPLMAGISTTWSQTCPLLACRMEVQHPLSKSGRSFSLGSRGRRNSRPYMGISLAVNKHVHHHPVIIPVVVAIATVIVILAARAVVGRGKDLKIQMESGANNTDTISPKPKSQPYPVLNR